MAPGIDLASVRGMNPKSLFVPTLAVAGLAAAFLAPMRSSGQAGGEDAAVTALLNDITAQQAVLEENQTQIDIRLADVTENVRLARITASRTR
jgi:hypothetical protein